MKRRRARVIALILGGLFLLLLVVVLFGGMGRPVRNPGLALQFLGFTNVAGSWFAQMAVTNSSSQQHFVEKAGKMVSFSGWASVRGQAVNLSTNGAVNWPGIIVAESSARFRVSFPEGVEQWQVRAWGYPSSWLTR